MKQKKIVRVFCLLMAVLMVMGVVVGALSTVANAAVVTKKKTVRTDKQPDLTFYDIDGNMIGTFSHAAGSDLIGFNASRVIYKDEEGQEIETNYGRVDVTLHLEDGTGKYSEMTQTRSDSYYLKYNMGSSTGEAFSNRITCSKGSDDEIDLDITLPNVVFRDSNEMKMNLIYQYPYTTKTTTAKPKRYIKTHTATLSFTFTKAKLDLTVKKPKDKTTITDKDTGLTHNGTYGDKDQLDKEQDNHSLFQPNGQEIKDGTGNQDNNAGNENGDNNQNGNGDSNNGNNNQNGNNDQNSGNGNGDQKPNEDEDDQNTPPTTNFETPYLVLQEFSFGGQSQIAAGSEFPLTFSCRNTSQQVDLENIIIKIAPGEGLQIVDSTNVFYLPIINKSDTFEKTVTVSVLPNAEAKTHPIDVSFSYEYVVNGTRQKGEMSQQISVPTLQPDRFEADPVEDLLESTVGEEIYITGKYVNKSRGEIYNLSATLVGDFNGAGKINHIGNVAAGASGDVEFSIIPDAAGPLNGEIAYSYEDAAGNVRTVSVPFATTINEALQDDMMAGNMVMGGMDMGGMDGMDGAETVGDSGAGFWQQVKNPNSWQMWVVVGGGCIVVILIAMTVIKKRKAAAEFEDDDETV